MLPDGALSQPSNAARVKQLAPLQTAHHVQWLLCGLGGEPVAAAAAAAAAAGDAGKRGEGGGPLKTLTYSEWMAAYRDSRVKKNTAGKPEFTEGGWLDTCASLVA